MFRQYYAGRWFAPRSNPLRVGPVAHGALYRLPEHLTHGRDVTWMVMAFCNGVVAAACRDPVTGRWVDRVIAGRSDRAIIRRLADGVCREIAVACLLQVDEAQGGGAFPELPDVGRYHRGYRPRPQALAA